MFPAKLLICACAVLAMGYSAVAPRREPLVVQRPLVPLVTAPWGDLVDVSPRRTLSSETPAGDKDVRVSVQGENDAATGQYWVSINLDAPIYVADAEAPGEPTDPISTSDEFEHVQVYFANEESRILEIRFNRFNQVSARVLSKPYNKLPKTLPRPQVDISSAVEGRWSAKVNFVSEMLPANMTRVNVAVIDPSKPEGGERYISTYRIYNHPLSILDMQVLASYKTLPLYQLVPETVNDMYSEWWSDLK